MHLTEKQAASNIFTTKADVTRLSLKNLDVSICVLFRNLFREGSRATLNSARTGWLDRGGTFLAKKIYVK